MGYLEVLQTICTTSLFEANAALVAYLPRYNARLGRTPQDPVSAYRPRPQGLVEERVFCFHYQRSVQLDNTIAFSGLHLPLPPSPTRRQYARAEVEVEMRMDGQLEVYYRGSTSPSSPRPRRAGRVDRFTPAELLVYRSTKLQAPEADAEQEHVLPEQQPHKPAPDHPWRHSPIGLQARVQGGDIFTGYSE